jgi:hypothetical protein
MSRPIVRTLAFGGFFVTGLAASAPADMVTVLQYDQSDFTQVYKALNPTTGATDLTTPVAGLKAIVTYTPDPSHPGLSVTDLNARLYYIGVHNDGLATGSNAVGSSILEQFSGEARIVASGGLVILDATFTDAVLAGVYDTRSPTFSATDGVLNDFGRVEHVTYTSDLIDLKGSTESNFSISSSALVSPGSPHKGLHLTPGGTVAAYKGNQTGTFALQSVPEPGSLTLLALGSLGAAGLAWRRGRAMRP